LKWQPLTTFPHVTETKALRQYEQCRSEGHILESLVINRLSPSVSRSPGFLAMADCVPAAFELAADHLSTTQGPWFVGAVGDFVMFGVLIMMTCDYYNHYAQGDTLALKAFVAFMAVASLLKTMQTFLITWEKMIIQFGDWEANYQSYWYASLEPITTEIICALAQSYFTFRLYRLSGRNAYIILVLVATILAGLGVSILMTVELFNLSNASYLGSFAATTIGSLACILASDVLITTITSYYLIFAKTGYKKIDSLIVRLVRITWLSAAPPALCALLNLVTYVVLSPQANTEFIAFNLLLSKLYCVSLMYTINTRSGILKGRHGVTTFADDGVTTGIQLHGPACPDLLVPQQVARKVRGSRSSYSIDSSFLVRASEM